MLKLDTEFIVDWIAITLFAVAAILRLVILVGNVL